MKAEKRAAFREDAPLNQDEFGALEMLLADAQWREFPRAMFDTLQRARSKLLFQARRGVPQFYLGTFEHKHGANQYLFDRPISTEEFVEFLGDEYEPDRADEFLGIEAIEVERLGKCQHSTKLHDMTVYFEEATEVPSGRQAFRCQAEDEAHAREQCLNAYPDAHIWCVDQPREAMKGDV